MTATKIAVIVEGKTEKVFKNILLRFLKTKLEGQMPAIRFLPMKGRIPKGEQLKKDVERLLKNHDAVIALTDVYTGSNDFETAEDAKQKMRSWVEESDKFYPHAAQHEFEAWLLPYWDRIRKLTGSNKTKPGNEPEKVNHGNPPSKRIGEAYQTGKKKPYQKVLDAPRILAEQDLNVAIEACPELKSFVNTILKLCGADPL